MVKSGNSGKIHIRELVYLVICGVAAIVLYLVWRSLGLSNSHLQPGHELESTETLNDH
ncbi:MAG: hypothetical protein JO170_28835 [Verrucomicrobia bacterium]|nr:hypothetical protein [Verrucomicrobiota bacterium]